jgi:uncharacterized protein (DUF302 family)
MKMFTGMVIGLPAGILIGLLIAFFASPSLMFRENRYSADFDLAVSRIEEAAGAAGWKIPYVHDLQATMKKFGKDVRKVKVFELCKPDYSFEILSRNDERIVSNMMPCRIAVYEKEDGSVWISRMNAGLVARPMKKVVRRTMSAAAADMEVIIDEVLAGQ